MIVQFDSNEAPLESALTSIFFCRPDDACLGTTSLLTNSGEGSHSGELSQAPTN